MLADTCSDDVNMYSDICCDINSCSLARVVTHMFWHVCIYGHLFDITTCMCSDTCSDMILSHKPTCVLFLHVSDVCCDIKSLLKHQLRMSSDKVLTCFEPLFSRSGCRFQGASHFFCKRS